MPAKVTEWVHAPQMEAFTGMLVMTLVWSSPAREVSVLLRPAACAVGSGCCCARRIVSTAQPKPLQLQHCRRTRGTFLHGKGFSPACYVGSRNRMPTCVVPAAALGDATNGDVPQSALDQQVSLMNQLMSNTPFTFVNAGVTRISNTSVRPAKLRMVPLCIFSERCATHAAQPLLSNKPSAGLHVMQGQRCSSATVQLLTLLSEASAQWWNVQAPGTPMNEMKAATRVGNYGVRSVHA